MIIIRRKLLIGKSFNWEIRSHNQSNEIKDIYHKL
jgi:hypothetical protein